jgi:CheY-like chemotaxis protein
MTNPMSKCYFASNFVATSGPAGSLLNLLNLLQPRCNASRMRPMFRLILILSDINMPGMTGLELLPKAKAVRPDVPVIMITAYGDADTKRKALQGGAEALFTKPIDFGMLRSEIDTRVAKAA